MKPIHYLKENGTIALVAPSFGCASDPYKTRLEAAIANFKADGFRLIEGENIFLSRHKVRSNTARKCAKEFMEHYLSPDSDAVISVGGGELMCEILPYIDFGKIRKAPHKFFMGFSDNTNLTYTLATISEVPTIYGPCFPSYGLKPYRYHVEDALNLLLGKTKITRGYPYWERYGTSGGKSAGREELFGEKNAENLSEPACRSDGETAGRLSGLSGYPLRHVVRPDESVSGKVSGRRIHLVSGSLRSESGRHSARLVSTERGGLVRPLPRLSSGKTALLSETRVRHHALPGDQRGSGKFARADRDGRRSGAFRPVDADHHRRFGDAQSLWQRNFDRISGNLSR